jgi:hypothetical protein
VGVPFIAQKKATMPKFDGFFSLWHAGFPVVMEIMLF